MAEQYDNSEQSVLECLCKSAHGQIKTAMLTMLDAQRADYIVQPAELVAFAIDFDINIVKPKVEGGSSRARRTSCEQAGQYPNGSRRDQVRRRGRYVARVSSTEPRTCYGCGEAGHIKAKCPKQRSGDNATSNRVALAIGTGTKADFDSWILDSRSSVHLVKDVKMLRNSIDCDQSCRAANNIMVRVTKKGSTELRTAVNSKEVIASVSEVYYAENLADNIIRYGMLERSCVFLERDGNQSYVVRQEDGMKTFEGFHRNNVLTVEVMSEKTKEAQVRVVNSALPQGTMDLMKLY